MKHFFAAALLTALLLLLSSRNMSSDPFLYDEADYMYTASLGYFAHWTDTPTLSILDFFRIGLGRGRQSGDRRELSEFIRQRKDVVFYRHWHGPLYLYLLIPVSRLGFTERGVRSAMLFIPALAVLAVYFGCLWLIPGARGTVAAILSSVLFVSSFTVIRSTELAPHQLFALCFICCLVLLAKAIATGIRAHWYAAVAMAALAFCALEVAFVLVLTLVLCACLERQQLELSWRLAGKSVAVFAATVLAVWPPAIFKLSFVKAYAFMAYLALFRRASWGNLGLFETWRVRLLNSPLEWAAVAIAIVAFFGKPARKENRFAYPILIFATLMIAATLRVLSETPRYALPFMPALDLFAGLVLASRLVTLRRPPALAIAALLVLGLLGIAFSRVSAPAQPNPRPLAVLTAIRESGLAAKALLVPQDDLPMIHYYFPAARLRGYYSERPAPSDLEGFGADALLNPGYPVRLERTP